ncbi:MAG: hypothetical protein J6U54_17625 [Clostridiales bacterium]|nr:hypothetical protein [Clostridiales bacterium]
MARDYRGDIRSSLMHMNPNHDPETGRFTSSPFGWGKYVDVNGNLTEEGKKRRDFDINRNATKKKDDKVKGTQEELERYFTDPQRWVREDLDAFDKGLKDAQNMSKTVRNAMQRRIDAKPKKRRKNLDLSNMTDQELRALISRYKLEIEYQDLFNPKMTPEVSKGKKVILNTLDFAGDVLAVGTSAVMIAKAINEMKKTGG